jgi:macrolide-specific efflux system membrane fusion protein
MKICRTILIGLVAGATAASAATAALTAAELKRPSQQPAPTAVRLEHCLVSLIDDVEIPAERAGVLTSLAVKEGDQLEKDSPVATVDAEQARFQHESSLADAAGAKTKADSQLEIDYAVATHRTAEAEYQIALSANQKQPGAVSVVELEKLRLAAEQAKIKIDVTRLESIVRGSEHRGFTAKANLAEVDIVSREIRSPIAGEVVEVPLRTGEWVEPGKPVVRIVRLDRLRVEGFVKFSELAPGDVLHRPVQVTVDFAGGRVETFAGQVTFVSPLVQPGGEYRIWAEVDNRRDGDQWLLRPGLDVRMDLVAPDRLEAVADPSIDPAAAAAEPAIRLDDEPR